MKKSTLFAAVIFLSSVGFGANWPHWRGPHYNGSTDETNLPSVWSQTDNIAWKAGLPGPSAATPIVWEDYVFISSADSGKETLLAMCFDRRDGKPIWQEEVAGGIRRDRRSNFAAPSPTTDGKVVIFFYSSGQLLGFTPQGQRLWARNIQEDFGEFAFLWTFSSSPLLYDGKLYLQILQRDVPVQGRGASGQPIQSYLLAMDPMSGKTLWRLFRESPAVAESREAFSSPIPAILTGAPQLVLAGGDVLTGHDPATGEELWRWGTWNPNRIPHWRLVPSPVIGNGLVLACGPKNAPIFAIEPKGRGTLNDSAVKWSSGDVRDMTSDVPTPAFYDGDFFVLSDLRRVLMRVDGATGKVKWSIETPDRAKYEASPLAADGKIYIINHEGDAAVVDVADGKILHKTSMDDPTGGNVVRASISAAQGRLFIRTTTALFCVGTK
ncbi:MAG: PQQ-binding-like beta-propeller repeat protein [Sedimentisphaerales bacterium]|nr:PQQ-binding-like beta-propeller repeat protein [Sedimentisphaerales bacterium]